MNKGKILILPWLAIIALLLPSVPTVAAAEAAGAPPEIETAETESWIVKWNGAAPAEFMAESRIIRYHETFNTYVAEPGPGIEREEWLDRWRKDGRIAYIHPNQKVRVLAAPRDEHFAAQQHLKQIRAPEAWDVVRENRAITIAVVDTGVDLTHPDLRGNLVPGINLIQPDQPPQDDHGHGTNVAGVIGAVTDNGIGVAGIVWRAKIMPVKAIEADGLGEEDKLGEGIRYAVDNGAKIVLLCVGLPRYSPFLEEVAEYAEAKGALLVSATGNKGQDVNYPAAYPTVLAVGGVDANKRVMVDSNYGPEVDLVAPWKVYTTALDGKYAEQEGTSMAAPQAAGVAALVWAQSPSLQPYEIRNLLRQTAEDIEHKGWDPYSGYGLLRADRAVKATYAADIYEPNNRRDAAKPLPVDTMISAELQNGADEDWFAINAPYAGRIVLELKPAPGTAADLAPDVIITHYRSANDQGKVYRDALNQTAVLQVEKGISHIRIRYADRRTSEAFRYVLTPVFQIGADPFEDNDRQYKAYSIPAGRHTLKGTFHRLNDQDWFSMDIPERGTLQLTLRPDTVRIDGAILIQRSGGQPRVFDSGLEGETEFVDAFEVTPGRYYILVSNVISDQAHPVRGEYTLTVEFMPKLTDPNEPNDRYYQATSMVPGMTYTGLIDKVEDNDWFSFELAEESLVELHLRDIPDNRLMLMTLLNEQQKQLRIDINPLGETTLSMRHTLAKGKYYVRLGANRAFQHQLYRLELKADPLVEGFRDISSHWARETIAEAARRGIISGYGDYTFRPDQTLTRAEAAVMIAKAFKLGGTSTVRYPDVSPSHWAYPSIAQGSREGIIAGYADGRFRPDRQVTRAEMAVMIAKAKKLKASAGQTAPFTDVKSSHWAAPWIRAMAEEGYVAGYADGRFKPEGSATRAEMTALLMKVLD